MNKEAAGISSFISFNRCCSHVISHDACVTARYSASVEDLDTVCCFLVCHEIRLSFRKMANPVVDLRVVRQEAQSESENPLTPDVVDPNEKNKPEPGEFFMYLKTLFTVFVSALVGCAMC